MSDIVDIAICLSIRPSVTRWYCVQTAKHIREILSPPDNHIFLVFSRPY